MKFFLKLIFISFAFIQIASAGRMYDPEIGRFISRDPLGYVDGMSMYNAYFAEKFALDPTGNRFEIASITEEWDRPIFKKNGERSGFGYTIPSYNLPKLVTDDTGCHCYFDGEFLVSADVVVYTTNPIYWRDPFTDRVDYDTVIHVRRTQENIIRTHVHESFHTDNIKKFHDRWVARFDRITGLSYESETPQNCEDLKASYDTLVRYFKHAFNAMSRVEFDHDSFRGSGLPTSSYSLIDGTEYQTGNY